MALVVDVWHINTNGDAETLWVNGSTWVQESTLACSIGVDDHGEPFVATANRGTSNIAYDEGR